jgi:DNA-binding NarL/FixJ family response regulator
VPPIRLVLVDDHPMILSGLEQLLKSEGDFEILAKCATASEGLIALESLHPDVLILDLKLSDSNGLEVLRQLNPNERPSVVVLTASHDEDELLDAARLGARGIVLKAMAPRVLEECIRTVHSGGSHLNVDGLDLSQRLADRQDIERELTEVLTPRELEIVRLIAARFDNQEIAERLSITVGTVKIHLHHIYEKLQVDGRRGLQVFLRSRQY